jgi:hypothetical protein
MLPSLIDCQDKTSRNTISFQAINLIHHAIKGEITM